MKETLRILAYIFSITCLVLLLAVLVVPRFTGLQFDQVVSGSMEPTIETGASIAIAKVNPAQIKVGDIIGFSVPGIDTRICHRVVGIVQTNSGYGFLTKGDANSLPDPWVVNPRNVVGKVYYNASWLLPFARFIRTPLGFAMAMVLPALLIIYLSVKEIVDLSRQRKLKQSPDVPTKAD